METNTLHSAERSDRALWILAVALLGVMFLFPLAISFPLLDPDEGLHASISLGMAERGNWITPMFLDEPFLDKPILYFWAQAASLWTFGRHEWAVRLPGLLFGLLGAVTTGLLAGRLFNRTTGVIATILYTTTILPTALAQAASHDVALIPCVNMTLLLFLEMERIGSARAMVGCLVGAGVFLAGAILTKGLFGVAVVGITYGGYLLLTHRLDAMVILRGMIVCTLAGLLAAPWYLAVSRENPGYLYYFFIERHIHGFATDTQPHGDQPWWYYIPVLLGGGLPWIGYLPLVVRDGQSRRLSGLPAVQSLVRYMPLLWFWLIGWTVLMTLAGSKLATYLWPAFPPMAILVATFWSRLIGGELDATTERAFSRSFKTSSWCGPIILPGAVFGVQLLFGIQFSWPVWAVTGVVAVATLMPLIPARAGQWQTCLIAAAMSVSLQFLVVLGLVLPSVAEEYSGRALAKYFNERGEMPGRLVVVEGRVGSVVYYLDPKLRENLSAYQIQQRLAKKLTDLRPGDVIVIQERKTAKLRRYFDADREPFEAAHPYRIYPVRSSASFFPID